MSNSPERYSKLAITLHWLIALMVIIALFFGWTISGINNTDPQKITVLRVHMIWGIIIGALMLIRIVVRFTAKRPAPARTGNALLDRLGGVVHFLLYLLVLGMVSTGIGISIFAGLPEIVFQGVGELPESFNDLPPRAGHGAISTILTILILLHIAAAFFHQFKLKDRLLGRMGIGKVK